MIKGHSSYESDWWALGTLLYEFIYGIPPFYNSNKEYMAELILNRKVINYISIFHIFIV